MPFSWLRTFIWTFVWSSIENVHPCQQSDTSPGTGPPPSQGMTNPGLGWTRHTRGIEKCWFTFQIIWFIMYAVWRTRCLSGQLPCYQLPGYRASLSNLLQTWIKCYIEPHTLYSTNQVTWLNKTKLDILHLHIKVKADKLQIISSAKYLNLFLK